MLESSNRTNSALKKFSAVSMDRPRLFIGGAPDYSGTEGAGLQIKVLAGVMVAAEGNSYSIFHGSIGLSSLALAANENTVYWTQGGRPHAAPLN
jgi:hypothetical protein